MERVCKKSFEVGSHQGDPLDEPRVDLINLTPFTHSRAMIQSQRSSGQSGIPVPPSGQWRGSGLHVLA